MNENEKKDGGLINSIDILKKSGLSRATLNNYIKMGILPHPIVKRPDDNTVSKAKQIGYFPYTVLNTLDRIIQYKKDGRRMAEICYILTQKSIGSSVSIQNSEQDNGTRTTSSQKRFSDYRNEGEELFSHKETQPGHVSADTVALRDTKILFRQGEPTLVSFSVLVAELQNSTKICAELPPEEYFSLIREIWESMTLSFKKYFGTYGKHGGNGIVYYFLRDRDSSYLMNAIICALELREMMKKLSDEWKMKKSWFEDLYLNVGISEGQEFLGSVPTAPAGVVISLGDSVNSACRLSDLACYGSIWTTKNLLNRLDEKDRKKIRYGIHRREQHRDILVENVFSRVIDLVPRDSQNYSKYMDIEILPVTEIQNLR
jgi:class 3 adenylate cyclase